VATLIRVESAAAERARRFMVEWDLIAPDATYEKLVVNVI
jgi:hypothetical protein